MNQEERILAARASRKKWAEANKERERERNRRWFEANPMYAIVREQNRKSLAQAQSDGTFTRVNIKKLFDFFGNRCLACYAQSVTIDHVVPLSLGGRHSIYNVQPLCKTCNSSKGNRSSADYRGGLTTADVDAILNW